MATSLDLINKVLLGLRKDLLSTATTTLEGGPDYPKLVLQWINTAKEEIEESHNWTALQATATVTGTASDQSMPQVSSGQSDITVLVNARLIYDHSRQAREPQVYDATDSTAAFRMTEVSLGEMTRLQTLDDDSTITAPQWFSLASDGTSIVFNVSPIPSGVRTYKLRFHQPQAELSETTLTTTITIPHRPVWLRALFYANQERGEEAGRPGSELDRQAHDALVYAIAAELDDDAMTSNWE